MITAKEEAKICLPAAAIFDRNNSKKYTNSVSLVTGLVAAKA